MTREHYLDTIAVDILKKFDGLSVREANRILELVKANVAQIGKLNCKGSEFESIVSNNFLCSVD